MSAAAEISATRLTVEQLAAAHKALVERYNRLADAGDHEGAESTLEELAVVEVAWTHHPGRPIDEAAIAELFDGLDVEPSS